MKVRVKTADAEAVRWTGANIQEISEFIAGCALEPREIVTDEFGLIIIGKEDKAGCSVNFNLRMNPPTVSVHTSNGDWTSTDVGGYIVRQGNEFHAWDREPFDRMFEPVP